MEKMKTLRALREFPIEKKTTNAVNGNQLEHMKPLIAIYSCSLSLLDIGFDEVSL